MTIPSDNPIELSEDDTLGRSSIASVIARNLRDLDTSNGCVAAIMGPWGSGKTSLMNLIRQELANKPMLAVLEFNPWMFSGADQLVDVFFRELAAQLHLKEGRLDKLAAEVSAYGDLLSPAADIATMLSALPFAGWLGRARNAAGAVSKFQERRKVSVSEQRKKLQAKLRELESPIVVMLDDIDRLSTSEIRDIFKLVRLTASFPNVIYIVAFDRKRVEDALSDTGLDGRSYLEKIVQLSFEIPAVSDGVLVSQIGDALEHAIKGTPGLTRFDADRWTDVLAEIVLPLVRNMRDIRRYSLAVHASAGAVGGEVELVDILALEAIRVFLPDLYSGLAATQAALTTSPGITITPGSRDSSLYRAQIEGLLKSGENEAVGRAVINRLFPVALGYIGNTHYPPEFLSTWLKARRVAHGEILRLYLERIPGSQLLAFTDAERAFTMLDDEAALDRLLRSMQIERLEDIIAALKHYRDDFTPQSARPATVVLLNLIPLLPERPRGFLGADARLVVTRVVLQLLRRLPDEDSVARAVHEALPRISTLSSRFQLITIVGHRENAGHKLVSTSEASRLENELIDQLQSAEAAQLAKEWGLLSVLVWALHRMPGDTSLLPTKDDNELNSAILMAAKTEVRSQTLDSRTVKREARLAWEDFLVPVYGGEREIGRIVAKLEEANGETKVTKLARRYLTGWRHKDFSDDD
jgi:hypothetical protein